MKIVSLIMAIAQNSYYNFKLVKSIFPNSISINISLGANLPLLINSAINLPFSLPLATSARNISPVEMCFKPNSFANFLQTVPFPLAGAPIIKIFNSSPFVFFQIAQKINCLFFFALLRYYNPHLSHIVYCIYHSNLKRA